MLIGRNVLKLMSTVIIFHHLPLLMVVEVSPQPLPCKPCSVLLLLLLNYLHPPEPAAVAILVQNFLSTFLQNKKGLFCYSCLAAHKQYFSVWRRCAPWSSRLAVQLTDQFVLTGLGLVG